MRRQALSQALEVWALLFAFAVINGLFRQRVLEPALGREAAHVLSTTTLAGFIVVVALFFVCFRRDRFSTRELLTIGALWAGLTAFLELGLGLARGLPARELFFDYDVSRGRLFGLVLLTELASPWFAGFLRRLGK